MQRDDDGMGRQIEREPTIHKMRQVAPAMPWHSKDKPFGVSQEEWDKTKDLPEVNIPRTGLVRLVDYGKCRVCGFDADYANGGFLYCATCWKAVEDDFSD